MKKSFYLLIVVILSGFIPVFIHSQTITTNPLPGNEFCAGTSIEVGFTITGEYQTDNFFIAQLSTNNFANFQSIGTVKAKESGKVIAAFPENLAEGTNYRIRVISSNPYIAGSDNGSDFTVHSKYYGSISLKKNKLYLEVNESNNYILSYGSLKDFTANWNFGKDAVPQTFTGTTPPSVYYTSSGLKNITCDVVSAFNCSNSLKTSTNIFVYGCEIKIDSTALVDSVKIDQSDDEIIYNLIHGEELRQFWILPNGSIDEECLCELDHKIFILETGASITYSGANGSLFFLKPGSSLSLKGKITNSIFVTAPGSSLMFADSGGNKQLDCAVIKYDYKAAPEKGIAALIALGYSGVKQDFSDICSMVISPNPAEDFIETNMNQGTQRGMKIA